MTKETLSDFSTDYLLHIKDSIDDILEDRVRVGWHEEEYTEDINPHIAWETPFPPYVY